MRHPFELDIYELESIDLEIQKITDEKAEKLTGGLSVPTIMPVGEKGGDDFTTLAIGEEGGDDLTTLAIGEEGGDKPTIGMSILN